MKLTRYQEDWINKFSSELADQASTLVTLRSQSSSEEFHRITSVLFLSKFTEALVLRALTEASKSGDGRSVNARCDSAQRVFLETKVQLQDAVAAAFQSAMSKFSGTEVMYYCKILAEPLAISKSTN